MIDTEDDRRPLEKMNRTDRERMLAWERGNDAYWYARQQREGEPPEIPVGFYEYDLPLSALV